MSTCTCGKPTRNDAYVCDDCLDAFAKLLGEVTWIDGELDITISKQRASGDAGAPSAEKPLPYDDRASAKADALRHELVQLVRFCTEEGIKSRDDRGERPENTLPALSRWLMWRVDGLAFNDMAQQFIADVSTAIRDCRRVIDLPPERSYAGPCPECKRDLYHRPNAAQVTCSGCGQRWDVGEVVAWMRGRIEAEMTDRLVTAREGATLLSRLGMETAQGTIDKWHHRALLAEAGHTAAGHRLYRWDDLIPLAARHVRAS